MSLPGITVDSISDAAFGKILFVLVLSACLTGGFIGVAVRRMATATTKPTESPPD